MRKLCAPHKYIIKIEMTYDFGWCITDLLSLYIFMIWLYWNFQIVNFKFTFTPTVLFKICGKAVWTIFAWLKWKKKICINNNYSHRNRKRFIIPKSNLNPCHETQSCTHRHINTHGGKCQNGNEIKKMFREGVFLTG